MQYSTPSKNPTLFNAADYIDTKPLTKSVADSLYVNEEPDAVERIIGSLAITNMESTSTLSVTNSAAITGACVIGGGLTVTGDTSIGQSLSQGAGKTAAVFAETTRLGTDTNNALQCTTMRIDGVSTNINTKSSAGLTTIGNGTNALRLAHSRIDEVADTVVLGKSTGYTYVPSKLKVGYDGSGSLIANSEFTADGSISLNRNTTAASSSSVGGTGFQTVIGVPSATAVAQNMTNAFNTFAGYSNKIYNPILLKQDGNESFNQFNLNRPHHLCTASGLTAPAQPGGTGTLPQQTSRDYVINLPNLPYEHIVSVLFDYTIWYQLGAWLDNTNWTVYAIPCGGTTAANTRSRVFSGTINLIIRRDYTNSALTFYQSVFSGSPANPFISQSVQYLNSSGGTTTTSFVPLVVTAVSGSVNKVKVSMNIPSIPFTGNGMDAIVCYGSSMRLISASNSWASYMYLSPSNQDKSYCGDVYLSLA